MEWTEYENAHTTNEWKMSSNKRSLNCIHIIWIKGCWICIGLRIINKMPVLHSRNSTFSHSLCEVPLSLSLFIRATIILDLVEFFFCRLWRVGPNFEITVNTLICDKCNKLYQKLAFAEKIAIFNGSGKKWKGKKEANQKENKNCSHEWQRITRKTLKNRLKSYIDTRWLGN